MAVPHRVCVIGGGPQGLAALKSLLELNKAHDQGPSLFEVELLESRNSIGGVWTFNDSASEITALRNTVQNTSRFRNCYTDFPVKEAWRIGGRDGHPPPYLTQEDSAFYLNQYAKYHNLKKHIRFGCRALALKRDEVTEQWQVETLQHSSNDRKWRGYDKIIVATGQHHDPMIPHVEGIENFNGQVLHSAEFKSNARFAGKSVLLIGSSNSAGDVATELAEVAKSVTISRRRGLLVAPRISAYRPNDVSLTRRMDTIIWMVSSIAPVYFAAKLAAMMKKMIMGGWQNRLKPEWNLNPEDAASISFQAPMVTDTIVPLLEAGRVKFVSGVRKITAVGDVELQDGHVMRPDAMIFCTGYNIDTTLSTEVQRVGDLQLPRLYHNIYHPEHPTSLAYLTFWYTIGGIYELGDLAAMGIAQVFAGRFKLPDHDFMQRRIEASHDFVNQLASRSPQPITFQGAARCVDRGPWITFLHEAAGTEVPSKLGYGFSGWKFWLSDRKFCHLLMNGVNSIHVARLFDGRPGSRPRWEGARKAIIEANEDVRRIEEERKAQYPKDKQA